jgi:hypothetical protein
MQESAIYSSNKLSFACNFFLMCWGKYVLDLNKLICLTVSDAAADGDDNISIFHDHTCSEQLIFSITLTKVID